MDLRALELLVVWAILAGAASAAVVWRRRASRQSAAAGVVATVSASLGLAVLGYGVGLYDVVMLGVLCCGDYRALGPSLGWTMWAVAAIAAAVPWVAWAFQHRSS